MDEIINLPVDDFLMSCYTLGDKRFVIPAIVSDGHLAINQSINHLIEDIRS